MDKIIKMIKNSDSWPSIKNAENLEIINKMANKTFAKGNFENKFAAMLMYHQIIETMCIHILEDCNFFIQLSLYPATINFHLNKSNMLGFYLEAIKKSIDFEDKELFLSRVQEFNAIRNSCVHELTKHNIRTIESRIISIKEKFNKIFELYDRIQDNFRIEFHGFAKNVFVDIVDNNEDAT